MLSQPPLRKGHTYWQWTFGLIGNMGFLIYGLEAAWISPTTKTLQSEASPVGEPLTNNQISWLGSISCFTAALFVIPFSYSADRFGRKWVVFAITVPVLLSIILRLFVLKFEALLVARVLAGSAASGVFVVIPIYVRELCQTNVIGAVGSLNVVLQNTGFLVMYLIGAYFDYFTVLWSYLATVVLMGCLVAVAPESPAYLVKRKRVEEAYATVAFLRGLRADDKEVTSEIEAMQHQEEEFKNMPKIGIREIFENKPWRRGVVLLLLVWTVQTWNGSFAIVTYASAILEAAGSELAISPQLQSVSFPIVMIVASFTLTVFVETCGRRRLHAGAYLVSAMSYAGLGSALLLRRLGCAIPAWLPIACMNVAVATYAGGIRSLPYIICIEIFNFQVRAKIMGLIQTLGWTVMSTQLLSFVPLADAFGLHTTFIVLCFINVLGMVFALSLPETRGKTEKEIMNKLDNKKVSN